MPHRATPANQHDAAADPTSASALVGQHVIVGCITYRVDGGDMRLSTYRMTVTPQSVTLLYDDGVEHVATDPAVIAYFTSGLVPSLQTAGRA